ncbi:MAG TPA: cytochrome p460 [Bacteroidetes bacterium]|nr:cytochrome p460 [Bacteroidota bacterium]
MKIVVIILFTLALACTSCNSKSELSVKSEVPDLIMPDNGLSFKEIEDYKSYKIVATHFRNDKNELRYILANKPAYKAYITGGKFPNGSKIVKIGWDVKKMPNFGVALEANEVQRVEYMIKDSENFNKNQGNWGYARFVKAKGKYKSWDKGTVSCVNCHNLAKSNDYLFTKLQSLQ